MVTDDKCLFSASYHSYKNECMNSPENDFQDTQDQTK
jgi:hypothetical protein